MSRSQAEVLTELARLRREQREAKYAAMLRLHSLGWTDKGIAQSSGMSDGGVASWRRKRGLAPNPES
jgi:hypothetical protein